MFTTKRVVVDCRIGLGSLGLGFGAVGLGFMVDLDGNHLGLASLLCGLGLRFFAARLWLAVSLWLVLRLWWIG